MYLQPTIEFIFEVKISELKKLPLDDENNLIKILYILVWNLAIVLLNRTGNPLKFVSHLLLFSQEKTYNQHNSTAEQVQFFLD